MTAKQFTQIRAAAGYTQQALADWLEVHLRSVQRWEGNERTIPGPVAKLMREFLPKKDPK